MRWIRKQPKYGDIPAVPLTVSLALANLQTTPGPSDQLASEFAEASGRDVLIQVGSVHKIGRLDRHRSIDVITLPEGSGSDQETACLHQLGHLMIGHDDCLHGSPGLRGDDRLQEVDAHLFAGLIADRYRQVRKATGAQHPTLRRLTAAYVLGTLDDSWPANVRQST